MGDTDKIRASIIIITSGMHSYLEECVEKCLEIPAHDYEIIIVPDQPLQFDDPKIRVIPSGDAGPSKKKNIGAIHAKGEVLAFIDSDAYPAEKWLQNGLKYFDDPQVAVVGGPNLTPKDDSLLQQANGIILGSSLGSGPFAARYDQRSLREGHELPSCNLFIRKSAWEKIGGFQLDLWPGEDAKFCFQVMDELGMRVIYAPEVVVYHHRRKLYLPYLKQIWGYGYTKGKIITGFSKLHRIAYFIPSLFILWLLSFIVVIPYFPTLRIVYLTVLAEYIAICIYTGVQTRQLLLGLIVSTGIFITHVTYGIAFIAGLASNLFSKKS